VIKIFKK